MTETNYRVLNPKEYSGSMDGDYGYEINGEKSARSYISRTSARKAMERRLEKMSFYD